MDGEQEQTEMNAVLSGLRHIKEPEYRALEQIVAEAGDTPVLVVAPGREYLLKVTGTAPKGP